MRPPEFQSDLRLWTEGVHPGLVYFSLLSRFKRDIESVAFTKLLKST